MSRMTQLPIGQKALAAMVGLSQKAISTFLTGQKAPLRRTSKRLAYVLGREWKEVYTATGPELGRIVKSAVENGTLAARPWAVAHGQLREGEPYFFEGEEQ